MQLFRFQKGFTPLLVINACSGTILPPEVAETMTEAGLEKRDTDWHLSRIIDLPVLESAAMLTANLSPYLIDLSQPLPGSNASSAGALVPLQTRNGDEIYREGQRPSSAEIAKRIEHFYQPFHAQLQTEGRRLVGRFGSAVVLDFQTRRDTPKDDQAPFIDFNVCPNCPNELSELIRTQVAGASSDELKIRMSDSTGNNDRYLLESIKGEAVYGVSVLIDQAAYLDDDDRCIDLAGIQLVMKQLEAILLPVVRWSEQHSS